MRQRAAMHEVSPSTRARQGLLIARCTKASLESGFIGHDRQLDDHHRVENLAFLVRLSGRAVTYHSQGAECGARLLVCGESESFSDTDKLTAGGREAAIKRTANHLPPAWGRQCVT